MAIGPRLFRLKTVDGGIDVVVIVAPLLQSGRNRRLHPAKIVLSFHLLNRHQHFGHRCGALIARVKGKGLKIRPVNLILERNLHRRS